MANPHDYPRQLDELLADPLRVARTAGGRVVGYVGDEIPVPLILAAGAIPLALQGDARGSTARADEILESAFSPALRAIAQRWLEGGFDFIDSVVFPRSDDSAQRLYYYLCELQRRGRCGGPRPLLYDVARIARDASTAHSRDSTRRLAAELGVKTGNLPAAVQRVARREALLADIGVRQRGAAPLPGSLAWRIRQAAGCDWRESFDEATNAWLTQAPTLTRPRRLVLAGNMAPDDSLHAAIEAAGGSVVLELTGALAGDSLATADSLDALADHFQALRNPVLAMRENAEWAARCARDAGAHGVVFWLIEEDEALPWEISRQLRALRDQGIPALLLSRQHWRIDDEAKRQVQEFTAALEMTK